MSSLFKAFAYVATTAFLLAGTLTGHLGHHELDGSRSSGHSAHLVADLAPDAPQDGAGGQGELDKTSCDFAHFTSCGMGHCCFPVPAVELVHAKGDEAYWASDVVAWEHGEKRLEPPPPKST